MPNGTNNRDYWDSDPNHPRSSNLDPENDMYDEWDDDSSESGHPEDDEFHEEQDDDYDENDEEEFSADEGSGFMRERDESLLRIFGSRNLPEDEEEEDDDEVEVEISRDEMPENFPEHLASAMRNTGLQGFAGDSPLARASRRLLLERFMDPLMDFGFENSLRHLREGGNRSSLVTRLESDDLAEVIEGLEGLSRQLLMGTLPMINARNDAEMDKLVCVLVKLLCDHEDVDVQLLSARCLCRLVESTSGAPSFMLKYRIIPVMRKKFENMIYIDLIEQLIGLIGPMVNQSALEFLEEECLVPLINSFDFFNEYDQKVITSAVEKIATEINEFTILQAKAHLRALPPHPTNMTINCTSALIGGIGSFLGISLGDLVNEATWNSLVAHLQPSEPNNGNYLKALCVIAKENTDWVGDIGLLAETVSYALVQQHHCELGDPSLVSKLLSVPNLALAKSMHLFDVIFYHTGIMLEENTTPVNNSDAQSVQSDATNILSTDKLVRCAYSIVPLAMAINSATLSAIECFGTSRGKSDYDLAEAYNESSRVVVDLMTVLRRDYEEFPTLANELRIIDFAKDLLTENETKFNGFSDGAKLTLELSQSPKLLQDLSASGIAGMVRNYKAKLEPGMPSIRYDWCVSILEKISEPENTIDDIIKSVIDSLKVKNSAVDFNSLKKVPMLDLVNAGFIEQLSDVRIEEHLCKPLVNLLVGIVNRLEHFHIQQSGVRIIMANGHATIPPIQVTLTPLNEDSMDVNTESNSYKFFIPPAATLRPIETILKEKVKREKISSANAFGARNSSETHVKDVELSFFDKNKQRVSQDMTVLRALNGVNDDTPTLYFREKHDDEDDLTADPRDSEDWESAGFQRLRSTLLLLQKLADFNERTGVVLPWETFQSVKLTAKVATQLDDLAAIMTSLLPRWIYDTIHEFPFLYSLKLRRSYVQLISLNFGRDPMFVLPGDNNEDDDDFNPDAEDSVVRPFGLYRRQKFRLSRARLLEGAVRMLEKSSTSSAVVEVMFFDEAGVGRGPTQEFFSLACKELSSPDTKMWKETPYGLFPAPNTSPSEEVLRYFSALGMLISRALLDRRTLDLTLHPAFFEAVVNKEGEPSVDRLRMLDPELAKTLDTILATPPTEIPDMGLDFTMPGSGEDLLPSGSEIPVTKENYVDYVKHVCEYSLGSGISNQIEAFIKGFDSTMPITTLECFACDELAELCGSNKNHDWSLEALRAAIVPSHGYHSDSKPFRDFLEVLHSLDHTERRLFLMFSTGSPTLPVGGFNALSPPFTVVIKYPEDETLGYDVYLPSVMTCTNYFKLPAYSNKETMRLRLRTAFSEGAGLFALS